MLRWFGIRPKPIWPAQRQAGSKSFRGYYQSQFEPAWAAYCPYPSHRHSRAKSYTYRAHDPSRCRHATVTSAALLHRSRAVNPAVTMLGPGETL